MAQTYNYSIAGDTLNSSVDSTRLTIEIYQSAIVTALDHIDTNGDNLDIIFKDILSSGDETILDGLVAAHTGEAFFPSDLVTLAQFDDTSRRAGITDDGRLRVETLVSPSGVAQAVRIVDRDNPEHMASIDEDGHQSVHIMDPHMKEAQFSAFGLFKVASESMLADYRFNAENILSDFNIETVGSGSYSIPDNIEGLQLNTGAAASSSVELTSKQIHYYQSGRGQLSKFSIILGDESVTGNIREWGYYDDDNGAFFRMQDGVLSFVVRFNGSEVEVDSTNWDVPVTPDEFGHLYYIQFEWLGVGNIYVYYDEVLAYTYNFIGTSTDFSMQTPDLPIRYRNENTTNTTDVYMKAGCASVVTEGGLIISGQDPDGVLKQVHVDEYGRLKISPITISPPSANQSVWTESTVLATPKSGGTGVWNVVIPTGEELTLQAFEIGAYVTFGDNMLRWKCLFYWQPNGDATGQELLDVAYLQGTSERKNYFERKFVGDGTARFSLEVTNESAGASEAALFLRGYY